MPDRSPKGAVVRGLPRSVRSGVDALLDRPWMPVVGLFELFAVTLATVTVLQNWLWNAVKTDLWAAEVFSGNAVATTPFNVILFQAKVGVALGVLLAAVHLGAHLRIVRGPIGKRHGRLTAAVVGVGVLLGTVALFAVTTPFVYRLLVPDAASWLAQYRSRPSTIIMMTKPIAAACLACGVGALFPVAMGADAASGRRDWRRIAADGALLALVAAVLGAVWWAGDWLTTAAWVGPVALGAVLGALAAAVVSRLASPGKP